MKAEMEIKNNLRSTLSKHKAEIKALGKEITALHKATDNFVPMENKPVFGENENRATAITADESREIVKKYEEKHPEFKKIHKELHEFLGNLMEMRVAAGLVSRENADLLKKKSAEFEASALFFVIYLLMLCLQNRKD